MPNPYSWNLKEYSNTSYYLVKGLPENKLLSRALFGSLVGWLVFCLPFSLAFSLSSSQKIWSLLFCLYDEINDNTNIKINQNRTLMEARFIVPYGLKAIQSIIAGKVCQERFGSSVATGGGAAGCIALAVRKLKVAYAGVQLASSSLFPFYLVRSPGTWNSATHI